MSSRHEELNRAVAEQLEQRRAGHLAQITAMRVRRGRPVTDDDQFMASVLACRNRRERRKAGERNDPQPRLLAVPKGNR